MPKNGEKKDHFLKQSCDSNLKIFFFILVPPERKYIKATLNQYSFCGSIFILNPFDLADSCVDFKVQILPHYRGRKPPKRDYCSFTSRGLGVDTK